MSERDFEYRLSWECPSLACVMAHRGVAWESLTADEWDALRAVPEEGGGSASLWQIAEVVDSTDLTDVRGSMCTSPGSSENESLNSRSSA